MKVNEAMSLGLSHSLTSHSHFFLQDLVHDSTGSTLTLDDGQIMRCKVVVVIVVLILAFLLLFTLDACTIL